MVEKYFRQIKYLLMAIFILFAAYVAYNFLDRGFCRKDYICEFVRNDDDYQRKLASTESNGTILISLALYNKICLKDYKTAKNLLEKSRLMREKELKNYEILAEDGNVTAMNKLKLLCKMKADVNCTQYWNKMILDSD